MKFRLKLIALIIFTLLILVCSYQAYWLLNFYNEQYHKMEAAVNNAMSDADFEEVAMRIVDLKKASNALQGKDDTDGESSKKPALVIRLEATDKDEDKSDVWDDPKGMYLFIQKSMHEKMDSIQGIFSEVDSIPSVRKTADSIRLVNFIRYDSLLNVQLEKAEVDIPYFIEYMDSVRGNVLIQLPLDLQDVDKSKCDEFVFSVTKDGRISYHLYLENAKLYIFKDMWQLLAVSVLMIVLLIISYIYLLKVILRQKTIDEIKSDFVNNMTHELKTPISVAYAAVDAMQNFGMGDDPDKRDKYLTVSKEQLMHLNSLVERILTTSVEERENLRLLYEDLSLQDLFQAMKDQFQLNNSANVQILISVQPRELTIQADRIHFTNIISNLIENAIKYSVGTAKISLSAHNVRDKIVISVSDNGIGIPHNSLDKIFDKFYRVPTGNIHDVKGYGLGLAYVKTIVDKHNWQISVESTEGQGSCFKIHIL